MALFVQMTTSDGREIIVNVDAITRMEALANFTRITFDRDNSIAVKDSPHHIIGGLPSDRTA